MIKALKMNLLLNLIININKAKLFHLKKIFRLFYKKRILIRISLNLKKRKIKIIETHQ
jgi:hypothetical protein